ncbi:hypothetical protein K491DRAFT_253854 [Lophiostoma macrostomum CBS 122681]|uniref:Uncharacterized protein n=1 Tax=Lophiostoma macrostomum CBS 122681 TaxID=1314788 RepID=A0A6A6TFL3_9PLEO|nr:hypothetical protein K491DRAFT_253854 [Lophiostoma macrostomum CBS 122681]
MSSYKSTLGNHFTKALFVSCRPGLRLQTIKDITCFNRPIQHMSHQCDYYAGIRGGAEDTAEDIKDGDPAIEESSAHDGGKCKEEDVKISHPDGQPSAPNGFEEHDPGTRGALWSDYTDDLVTGQLLNTHLLGQAGVVVEFPNDGNDATRLHIYNACKAINDNIEFLMLRLNFRVVPPQTPVPISNAPQATAPEKEASTSHKNHARPAKESSAVIRQPNNGQRSDASSSEEPKWSHVRLGSYSEKISRPTLQSPISQTPTWQTPITQTPISQTPISQTPKSQTPDRKQAADSKKSPRQADYLSLAQLEKLSQSQIKQRSRPPFVLGSATTQKSTSRPSHSQQTRRHSAVPKPEASTSPSAPDDGNLALRHRRITSSQAGLISNSLSRVFMSTVEYDNPEVVEALNSRALLPKNSDRASSSKGGHPTTSENQFDAMSGQTSRQRRVDSPYPSDEEKERPSDRRSTLDHSQPELRSLPSFESTKLDDDSGQSSETVVAHDSDHAPAPGPQANSDRSTKDIESDHAQPDWIECTKCRCPVCCSSAENFVSVLKDHVDQERKAVREDFEHLQRNDLILQHNIKEVARRKSCDCLHWGSCEVIFFCVLVFCLGMATYYYTKWLPSVA